MKIIQCLFITGIIFLSLSANAQTKNEPINNKQTNAAPVITKGYYSIGNNAEKLKTNNTFQGVQMFTPPVVQKGYYSIGNHSQKLSKQVAVKAVKKAAPVITKGYYSIGNNAEKLQ